jgi:hypothetical protein
MSPIIDDPISARPANPVYRESDTPDTPPDIIINNIAKYLCWRNFNASNSNHWKICRVKEVDLGDRVEIRREFPWGCDGYNFKPQHIFHYEGYDEPGMDNFKYKY